MLSDTDLSLSTTILLFYLPMLSNLSLFSACVKSLNDCERGLILTNKTPTYTRIITYTLVITNDCVIRYERMYMFGKLCEIVGFKFSQSCVERYFC